MRESGSLKMVGKDGMLLVFSLFLLCFCEETASQCRKLTACSCMFPDGQGYSLSPLVSSSSFNVTKHNYTFYFHPCSNARISDIATSECRKGNGVSLCAKFGNETFSLGTTEETNVIVATDTSEPPYLVLRHANYTTTIALDCCPFCKTHLTVDSVAPETKEYHLSLPSPYACKTLLQAKGFSTGSLLLVYFFVFSGIYFIGGAIALKFLRGATGWEMIPNNEFWRDLPALVKEGITFTFNCCRVDSYDRI